MDRKKKFLDCASAFAVLMLAVLGAAAPNIALAQNSGDDAGTLRSVSILFRHGAISPKYSPPKVTAEWPMGFKQLTAVGMRTM